MSSSCLNGVSPIPAAHGHVSLEAPREVLVIVVSRIGDSLFATPAIRAIAAACPNARITVLGHPKRAEVFRHLPFVGRTGTITKERAVWRGRLGKRHYDLAFVFGFDEPLVAYALRVAAKVVAFEQTSIELNRRLFVVVPRPPFQSEHAVDQLLRLPAALGIASAGRRIAFSVAPDELAAAAARIAAAGVPPACPLIGLQVASFPTKGYRDWPIEYFVELCSRLSTAWPTARFLIFGGKEERLRTQWLSEQLGDRSVLFAGRLTLRETAATMALVHAYIGVDTGPTHIMSAFDVPLVGLYHCVSPACLTGPLDHPCAYLIDHPTPHEACSEATEMSAISVDTVYSAVERALAEHPPLTR